MKVTVASIALLMALLTVACHSESDSARVATPSVGAAADLVVTNARVFTSNANQPWAEALVVRDGEFIYVGDTAGAASFNGSVTVDLNGRLIVPGLIDSHAHPGYVNVEDFGSVEGDTKESLLASVKDYAEQHPDQKWLRLCCWPTDWFVEGSEGPNREVLDALLPDRLVWFESETGHDYWLNSRAMAELGISETTPDPKPGLAMFARDENGHPSGWVKEGAGVQYFAEHFALTDPGKLELHRDSVAETLQVLSRHGVTAIFDAGNKGFGDLVYGVVSELEKQGRLPLRYYGTYQIFTPDRAKSAISEVKRYRREYGGELLQFNSVKVFMDGISANQSAAFLAPYLGSNVSVEPLLSVEELRDLLIQLHEEKLDLMVHSIGDLATRTVLDAVEAAHKQVDGEFYPRVTIAHLVLIHPEDLPRIKELGLIANFSPWWFGVTPNDVVEDLLGVERYAQMYQAKSVFDSGATVNFSSDEWWGGEMLATYISPYLGMQIGHTRQNPKVWWETEDDGVKAPKDERLSLEQLLEGYTQNGAYQLRLENALGSIEPGKEADFVVLNKDLFNVDSYEIWELEPTAVVMRGSLIQGAL